MDRMVDFVFGSGEGTYHLILEMYSQVGRSPLRKMLEGEGEKEPTPAPFPAL